MKAKTLFFLVIMTLTVSYSYARVNDETRIIILEALDNEKTRSIIDIPMQAQVQEDCILLQVDGYIGITTIQVTDSNGNVVYTNQILGNIDQYIIDLSSADKSGNYLLSIQSPKGNFRGTFTL